MGSLSHLWSEPQCYPRQVSQSKILRCTEAIVIQQSSIKMQSLSTDLTDGETLKETHAKLKIGM